MRAEDSREGFPYQNPKRDIVSFKESSLAKIKLYFSGDKHPELFRISFYHPLLNEARICVRGKSTAAFAADGSFQWSSAVRALSILLLKAAADRLNPYSSSDAILEGGKNTLTASLDYALAKEPLWISDVFGKDKNSRPLSRKLFRRSNPEGIHDGPRAVSLADNYWSKIEIFIDSNDRPVLDASLLLIMAKAIESPKQPDDNFCERFAKLLFKETSARLSVNEIFHQQSYKQYVKSLLDDPSFNRIGGDIGSLVSEIDRNLSKANKLGLLNEGSWVEELFKDCEPIRAVIPHTCPSALCIFTYLRDVRGFNLDIDFTDPHTVDVSRKMIAGKYPNPPDICCLAVPPAAALFNKVKKPAIKALMFMPPLSQQIVANSNAKFSAKKKGEFLFVGDIPTMSTFLYEKLIRNGVISSKKYSAHHMEADEMTLRLKESDQQQFAMLFFPHSHLNSWFNGCKQISIADQFVDVQGSVLFVNNSWDKTPQRLKLLDIAIRDAWLELRANPQKLEQRVRELVDNSLFMQVISRHGGLFHLPTTTM